MPHTFYLLQGEHVKPWRNDYAALPQNHIILPKGSDIPVSLDVDLIWSQNKFAHYQFSSQLSRQLHCPLISLEHTLPPPNWGEAQIKNMTNMKGNINVYISEYSLDKWLVEPGPDVRVIKHCVDSELFACEDEFSNVPRKNVIMSCCNDFIGRDWCLNYQGWRRLTKDLPIHIVGDTKGLSIAARDVNELVSFYNESSIFLNTSIISPIPSVCLEAAACGCGIVSTNNCMIPEIFTHGKDAFLSNDEKELRNYCEILLKDPDLSKRMGLAARQTILEKCSVDRFLKEWEDLFQEAAATPYIL